MPGKPRPSTPSELRTVLLFLYSFALRPVEGHDDPTDWDADDHDARGVLTLRRTPLAVEWAHVADSPEVRDALGRRPSERTLGRSGFAAAVLALSDDARDRNPERAPRRSRRGRAALGDAARPGALARGSPASAPRSSG